MALNLVNYEKKAENAVKLFWGNREAAKLKQINVMVTGRPYRQAKTIDEALAIISQEAGKQFDPSLVDVFFEKVVPTLQQ